MRYTPILLFPILIVLTLALAPAAHGQERAGMSSYRGVEIGASKESARSKLGKVKDEFSEEDDFVLSDDETARVFYTEKKTVKAIVITYTGKIEQAPAPKEVLGEEAAPAENGSVYKLIRHPDRGFWISYSRSAGDKPVIMITLQELPK